MKFVQKHKATASEFEYAPYCSIYLVFICYSQYIIFRYKRFEKCESFLYCFDKGLVRRNVYYCFEKGLVGVKF